ncbi:MAG: hypothetical protein AAF352_02325 [Pseudomonadota bacterium]
MTGIINEARMQRRGLFLNFDKNWREDVTILIPKALAKPKFWLPWSMEDAGDWQGRRVLVRGSWLRYNGPFLVLSWPGQLQILD